MNRKIKSQLFENAAERESTQQKVQLSLKDWKEVISRLNQTQLQVESCHEKINTMYSRLVGWLTRITTKIDEVSQARQKLESATHNLFQQWEKKVLDWVKPEQRQEDQRHVVDLMHRHSQFIQGYGQNLDTLKKSMSRNEYHISQLLSEIRNFRLEMDLVKRQVHAQSVIADQSLRSRSFNMDYELSEGDVSTSVL